MAERTSFFVPKGTNGSLRDGEQMVEFHVWPVDPVRKTPIPARHVKVIGLDGKPVKNEKGEDILNPVKSVALFRCHASNALMDGWNLSGFWEDIRTAMWHRWKGVVNVEDRLTDPNPEEQLMPVTDVTGVINSRTNKVGTSTQSVKWTDIPYDVKAREGAFSFDKSKGQTEPFNNGNIAALIECFRTHASNAATCGLKGDPKMPKILWIPFSEGWTKKDKLDIAHYESNLKLLDSWIGKLVYWNFVEVEATEAVS